MDKVILIKKIDGMQWASDVMNGQKQFPTYNNGQDDSDAFADIFETECSKEQLDDKETDSH